MNATRLSPFSCGFYSQPQNDSDAKRSRRDAHIDLNQIVEQKDFGRKKAKPEDLQERVIVVFEPDVSEEEKEEKKIPNNKRVRSDDVSDVSDVIEKMERVTIQTRSGSDELSEKSHLFRFAKQTLSIELDSNETLDISNEEFICIASRYPHFIHLNICNSNRIGNIGIIRVIMGRADLKSVTFKDLATVEDWTLQALGGHCPNLSKLSLIQCSQITNAGLEEVVSKCNSLEIINLDWCHSLSNRTLQAIGKHCPNLREFSISECGEYSIEGFKALVDGCPKLERLELWRCKQVDDEWLIVLIASKCQLKVLDVFGCKKITEDAHLRLKTRFPGIIIGWKHPL